MPFVLNNITFYTIFIKWLVFISSVLQPLNGQSVNRQQTPLTMSENNPIKTYILFVSSYRGNSCNSINLSRRSAARLSESHRTALRDSV